MKGTACEEIGLGVTFLPQDTSRWQSRNTFGPAPLSLQSGRLCTCLARRCFPLSVDFPLVGAVCELGEAGIPRNPSYSFVNGG